MKQLAFIPCALLLAGACCGQQDTTFRGLPVIPFHTPKGDRELDSIRLLLSDPGGFGLADRLRSRSRALDFMQTLATVAEPTTVSFFPLDWTVAGANEQQKKPFVLNADVRTPIVLGGKRWKMNSLHIIPQFKVRIFWDDTLQHNDSSLPVRTPSYMPGVAWYFSHRALWERSESDNSLKGFYGGIHAFHHSNGQDGPEFLDAATIQRLRLRNVQPGQLNVYNGNFSEIIVFDFIIGGIRSFYHVSKTPAPEQDSGEQKDLTNAKTAFSTPVQPNRLFYWRVSYEWHEKRHLTNRSFILPGNQSLYGRNRLNAQLGYSFIPTFRDLLLSKNRDAYVAVTRQEAKELFRFVLGLGYLTDTDYYSGDLNQRQQVGFWDAGRRLNATLTGYWRITGAPNAALFLQASRYGSDNYNMYFQQSLWQFRGGIAMAFFQYPRNGDFGRQY